MDSLNVIHPTVKLGENVKLGRFVILEKNVVIGDNTVIGDFVKLMPDTVIGENCILDDYVTTSGYVNIGNNVIIKRCSMIGQATQIDDNAWIGSGITTTRLKFPNESEEEWVYIRENAVIGSKALLLAGVEIGKCAIVGAGSIITKDCIPHGVYIGTPAQLKRIKESTDGE